MHAARQLATRLSGQSLDTLAHSLRDFDAPDYVPGMTFQATHIVVPPPVGAMPFWRKAQCCEFRIRIYCPVYVSQLDDA